MVSEKLKKELRKTAKNLSDIASEVFPPEVPRVGQNIRIKFENGDGEIETSVTQRELRWLKNLDVPSRPVRQIIVYVQHGFLVSYPDGSNAWSYSSSGSIEYSATISILD